MRFSILVAFKNRDEIRAKNFFDSLVWQTFKDFEVILINQGSDEAYNVWVEKLLLEYLFLQCIHTETRGFLWNKGNALNIGIKAAQGEYVVIADIDLIFKPDYLEQINKLVKAGVFLTHNVYYLPEKFLFKNIAAVTSSKFNDLFTDGVHSACVIERDILLQIKGYDEYYMVWGVEDDDIIRSLINVNQKQEHFSAADINIYHQWHPSVSPGNPRPWYLLMVTHLFSVKRDETFGLNWGKKMLPEDREVLKYIDNKKYLQNTKLNFWDDQPLYFFNSFIEGFHQLTAGEVGYIEFSLKIQAPTKTLPWYKKKTLVNIETEQITNKDISQFFHFFIGSHLKQLQDYFYSEENNIFFFVFLKINSNKF